MTDPPPPVPPPSKWLPAKVVEIRPETATAKTFRLELDRTADYVAGQHYVLRLSAPDGYTAQRSYSVASAPDGSKQIELTVERLEEGEVSTFLHDEVVVGDDLEVRGPIGGWFVWRGDTPALLIGGGSGVVPVMAMLRLARRTDHSDLVRLVVSARAPEDLYYAAEIPGPETTVVYTRRIPGGLAPAAGPAHRGRPALPGVGGHHRLCVRVVRLRRRRHRSPPGCRRARGTDPGRAVRPDPVIPRTSLPSIHTTTDLTC